MEKYIPNIYKQSIYAINYDALKEKGITLLLFDLDNTIVSGRVKQADEKVKDLFDTLKSKGFTVVIFSNSPKKRLKPFESYLKVESNSFSLKPLQKGFKKILKKYELDRNKVAIIGDQILTDVLGGNKAGIITILIDPITVRDIFLTKFNRMRENKIIEKIRKRNGFSRGKYYE